MKNKLVLFGALFAVNSLLAQDFDMLNEIDSDSNNTTYASASYKNSRIINSVSLKNTNMGVMDVRISHRFGNINSGFDEFFGLDNAITRIGVDYGVTNWLMVGVGRSTYEKAYDGFFKAKILRQSTGAKNMPISLQVFSSYMINGLKASVPNEVKFSSRLGYTYQIIIGRKFSEGTTIQLMPTLVHRNLVATKAESNDVFSLGIAGRQKFSKRAALTYELYYVPEGQLANSYQNYSLSLGVDIETGGHVFQLFLTNSTGINEQQFITQNTGNWGEGTIRLGFNISRVFTIYNP